VNELDACTSACRDRGIGFPYRVEKIMGTELTHTALAFLFPQLERRCGIEEFSVIVSPGFIR
jgi:hypothetical protein